MSMDDQIPAEDEQLPEEACGSCPYCGQPIAAVEIESAFSGVRFERAAGPPDG